MILLIESHGFSFFDGIFFSCHLERQSRGLLTETNSSAPVLRTSVRNEMIPLLGMTPDQMMRRASPYGPNL